MKLPKRFDLPLPSLLVMIAFCLVAVVGSTLHSQEINAKCVKLVNQPLVLVDQTTGGGTATLLLRNQLNIHVHLALTAEFSPTTTVHTLVQFASTPAGTPSPVLEGDLPPHSTIPVSLFVRDDWNDGQQDIELFNHYGRESMGKIHVQRVPVSFSLEDPRLNVRLIDGEATKIVLKNNAPISYPNIRWMLMDDQSICEDRVDISPRSSTILNCTPHLGWHLSALASVIKSQGMHDGYRLVLFWPSSDSSPPNHQIPLLASLPGRASLDYFHSSVRASLKYFIIFALLSLGGITSLALSYYIPNKLLRLGLREKLLNLAVRTSDLSSRIDSRLAVLVRLERSRLTELLRTRGAFSPDFGTVAALCAVGIQRLAEKVSILEQMDTTLGRLEQRHVEGVPPTRVDQINVSLEDAKVILRKSEMKEDDVRAVKLAVESATHQVSLLKERDDDFGRGLADACKAIAMDLKSLASTPAYAAICVFVTRPLNDVYSVSAQVTDPGSYLDVDYALNKARIIQRYIRLRDAVTVPAAMERLLSKTDLLVALLQRKSWDGLRGARLLLREMEDDIYPERIVEAVLNSAKEGGANEIQIQVDPAFVYESAPVEFSLRFYSSTLDTCAAREEFVVEWEYDDGHKGEGWLVSHYFLRRKSGIYRRKIRPFLVKAQVFDPSGRPIMTKDGVEAVLKKEVALHTSELWRRGERTRAEVIKLGAALVVAAVALVSGAETQIDKLDLVPGLVAVFLVGFSADSIKRLLTSSNDSDSSKSISFS